MTDNLILDENGVENMEGKKGTKVIAPGIDPGPINDPIELPLKEADLPKYAEMIVAAKGTPQYVTLLEKFEGPDTGVDFNEAVGTFRISDGWTIKDGYIVKA